MQNVESFDDEAMLENFSVLVPEFGSKIANRLTDNVLAGGGTPTGACVYLPGRPGRFVCERKINQHGSSKLQGAILGCPLQLALRPSR